MIWNLNKLNMVITALSLAVIFKLGTAPSPRRVGEFHVPSFVPVWHDNTKILVDIWLCKIAAQDFFHFLIFFGKYSTRSSSLDVLVGGSPRRPWLWFWFWRYLFYGLLPENVKEPQFFHMHPLAEIFYCSIIQWCT